MKLFLVRHGETEENISGILTGQTHGTLTEKGREQGKELANALRGIKFDHIYTSDLKRCEDVAKQIIEFHPNTPLSFTKELRERNLGVLQGKPISSVDWESLTDDQKPENGESRNELRSRAINFVDHLYRQHQNENVLLISHNGWIRQVISHFKGVHAKDIAKVNNAQVIEIQVSDGLVGIIIN